MKTAKTLELYAETFDRIDRPSSTIARPAPVEVFCTRSLNTYLENMFCVGKTHFSENTFKVVYGNH